MLSVDTLTATLVVGSIIPLLVSAVTQTSASPAVKAAANLVLTVAAGIGSTFASGRPVAWQELLIAGFAAYAASGTAHQHLWKPTGVTKAVDELTRGIGVG